MALTHFQYIKSKEEIERIIGLPLDADFKQELQVAALDVDKATLREYYTHMSTLFLNIVLNRTHEFGEEGVEKAFRCREAIADILTANK